MDENDGTFSSHAFLYDIELILGGKLSGLERSDLIYTTASQEGMTGDSRVRRKRKPSAIQEAANDAATTKKPKTKAKKKAPAAQKPKKAPATTKKAATSKKRAAASEKKQSKKVKAALVSDDPPPDNNSTAMDMYEKHRREFERSLVRLEKADAYEWFLGDVPDEFDECYIKPPAETSEQAPDAPTSGASQQTTTDLPSKTLPQTAADPPSTSQNDISNSSSAAQHEGSKSSSQSPSSDNKNGKKKAKKKKSDDNGDTMEFPTNPPYNIDIIRKRMEHGRYILDREELENDEHVQLMTPYFKSIGKNIPKRKKKKILIPVLHPKGVNWDLFRQDVFQMCDAAVNRNPEVDGSVGSLRHTANKIKEVMEQIYEKTGSRHNMEMSSANDRHRFSLAMDSTLNTAAAMQGKWRRDGKNSFDA
jgi:hypothetical protein